VKRGNASPFQVVILAVMLVMVTGLSASVSGQETAPPTTFGNVELHGLPNDWSHHHAIFSNPGTEEQAKKNGTHAHWLKVVNNPRYVMQQLHHGQPAQGPASASVARVNGRALSAAAGPNRRWGALTRVAAVNSTAISVKANPEDTNQNPAPNKPTRDWSFSLGAGTVAPYMWPAKYSFNVDATPSCTGDYAVFGLDIAGSASQANMVALNNLYSGTNPTGLCGTAPTVMFAYNVSTHGGAITTSPVLYWDGSQIAFVESTSSASYLHILKWSSSNSNNGTVAAPVTPTPVSSMSACTTAPCMITVPFGSASDTLSSPFYSYDATDSIYVGNDNGQMFQITGSFNGTPTLGWSSQVAATGVKLAGPTEDFNSCNLFAGGSDGYLYAVASGAAAGTIGGTVAGSLAVGSGSPYGGGIVNPPIVDEAYGTVLGYTMSNAANVAGSQLAANTQAVVVQADTTTPFGNPQVATLGQGTKAGIANLNVASGTFDNAWWSWPGAGGNTGNYWVIGTDPITYEPASYQIQYSGIGSISLSSTGDGYSSPYVSFPPGSGNASAITTGGVDSITLTAGGSGYTVMPTATFSGGGGSGATATVEVGVSAIALSSGGSNYTSVPSITFGTAGQNTAATATPSLGLDAVSLTTGGSFTSTATLNYTGNATLTPNYGVTAIGVTTPGSFTAVPTIAISGSGTGGGTATLNLGVNTLAVNAAGSGYTAPPTINFPSGGNPNPAASATALMGVNAVIITGGGSYTSGLPTMTFSAPPSGTTATATVTGSVSAVSVSPGAGGSYTAIPTLTFGAPPSGTTATGTSTIGVLTVHVTTAGSYSTSSLPTVSFTTAPAGGTTALGTPGFGVGTVTISPGGSYAPASLPTVTFGPAPTGGTTAGGSPTFGVLTATVTTPATYSSIPTVTFATSSGIRTLGSATFSILGVNVSAPGSYSTGSLPTVSIAAAPSGGTNAVVSDTFEVLTATVTTTANYSTGSLPTVSFSAPTPGTTAAGHPTYGVPTGTSSVSISPTGCYSSAPSITFSAPSSGTTTLGTVNLASTRGSCNTGHLPIASIDVTTAGSGYTSAPTISFSGASCHSDYSGACSPVATVTTLVLNGISVTTDGTGYTSAPTISFSSGGAAASVATMGVQAVAVTTQGSGYTTSFPAISFSGSGGATAAVNSISVNGINVTTEGNGYTGAPGISFSPTGASASVTTMGVTGITISPAGSGYTSAPSITFSSGTAAATVATMTVTGVAVTTQGSGYTAVPNVNFSPTGAVASVNGVTVTGVNLTNSGGSGYTSAPNITFSTASGSGASATVSAMTVSGITGLTPGSGYLSGPTITFSSGGATATANNLKVVGVQLVTAGSYTSTFPTATATGGATFITTADIVSVNLGNAGSYTTFPTAATSGGGTGATQASLSVTATIASVAVTSPGSGYQTGPVAVTSTTGGFVGSADLKVVSIGNITAGIYSAFPTATITGNATLGALTVDIVGVSLPTAPGPPPYSVPSGSGYTSAPSVSFTGTGGSGGTASTTISVTNAIVVYGGGGFDPLNPPLITIGDVGSGTGAAVSAIVNPGWIISAFPYPQPTYLGNPGDAGNQVGNTSSAQASPLNEIYNDSNDMLFYGFGLAGTGGVGELVAQNITPGGGSSNPSPYTVPNATGGTSAAVVDNISTANQASSIYFAELGQTLTNQQFSLASISDSQPSCSPLCFGTEVLTVTATTTNPNGFTQGESITVAGTTPTGDDLNGSFTIASITNSKTFTFSNSVTCLFICPVGSLTNNGTVSGLSPAGYYAVKLTQLGLQ
jgi:hypothetical protein